MDQSAPQRPHDPREVFNALRWLVRVGAPWRKLPMTCHRGKRCTSKADAGLMQDFLRQWSDLRSIIRVAQGQPSAVVFDGRTLQSSCERGPRAGYDGYKRRNGSKVHMAVDTLGHLLAVHVTIANEQERDQVDTLCQAVQQATGSSVEKAWVDQGYTGKRADEAAA